MLPTSLIFLTYGTLADITYPCQGNVVITADSIKRISTCQSFVGNLILDGRVSPMCVSMKHLTILQGDLVLYNYPGSFHAYPAIHRTLKIINQTFNSFPLHGVEDVSSLYIENSFGEVDFKGLKVADSLEIKESYLTSVVGLIGRRMETIAVTNCTRLRKLSIDGLQEVTDVKISNTALTSFDFLQGVSIENELFIEKYKFLELFIEAKEIDGGVTLANNQLLRHIYFAALEELDAPLVTNNNPELRFIQFLDKVKDIKPCLRRCLTCSN
ncbi:protoplasts-secreted [Entomophthora muscae]|uniref:Protoplasts-secreted n=1 Tax=Entomophthora muscae TaxID=34485 RepID=A0ACC2UTS5_9FUNG|nr:protoplasts-secreted [Entomophthora muscae]